MMRATSRCAAALTRRRVLAAGAAAGVAALLPGAVLAFGAEDARALIQKVIDEIRMIVGSGKPEAAMLRDFEGIFDRYADKVFIAQRVLGPPWRRATPAQRQAFSEAFKIYISHKYGRRFREMIGARIDIRGVRRVRRYFEVVTTSHLKGQAPFEVIYVVYEKTRRFIDIRIEGISLIKSQREEIGAMLDRRHGDLDRLIADLRRM